LADWNGDLKLSPHNPSDWNHNLKIPAGTLADWNDDLKLLPDEISNLLPMSAMKPEIDALDSKADLDKFPLPPLQQ